MGRGTSVLSILEAGSRPLSKSIRLVGTIGKGGNKVMTIEPFEFIRRFLLHVLPDNFVKIRHFGILSNSNRTKKLKKCQELLNPGAETELLSLPEDWAELLFFLTCLDLRLCPLCKKGKMVRENTIAVPLTDTS